jgi:hypothetical protein
MSEEDLQTEYAKMKWILKMKADAMSELKNNNSE